MADKKIGKPVVVVPGIRPVPFGKAPGPKPPAPKPPTPGIKPPAPKPPTPGIKPPAPKPPTPGIKPPAPRPPTPGIKPPAPGYYYYNDYGSDEVIQIILKKYCAVELLNALIVAL